MNVTHDIKNIALNSGEIAELFNTYINNSASTCILSYFAEIVKDPDIASIVRQSLDISKIAVERITAIFKSVDHPIPRGFLPEDVNIKSKRLYSDKYILFYIRDMARFGLTNYAEARASSTRFDVRDFFNEAIRLTNELFNNSDDILLGKGLLVKPPHIPVPKYIDLVKDQSFLAGFIGEKRPLNASEINRIYLNYQRNSLGKALTTGFCQTSKTKDIHEYFIRGRDLAAKHMKVMGSLLQKDSLTIPPILDEEVTDSMEPVFSERLMLYHLVALDALGLASTGITFSRVMRRDIALEITQLMADIALYAEDGFNLMIKHEWFERVPENIDRKELIKR